MRAHAARWGLLVALPVVFAAMRPAHAQSTQAIVSGTPAAPAPVVNINTATEEELQRLPGVGPARAAAIAALRRRVLRFRRADDLLRVRGIGRAALRRMRGYVALSGDTTLASRPAGTQSSPARQ